jgi:hypothetical protein
MALVDVNTLAYAVSPFAKKVPAPVLDIAMRRGARDFFMRTDLWREWLDPFDLIVDESVYVLTIPAGYGAAIREIIEVELDGAATSQMNYGFRDDGALVWNEAPQTVQEVTIQVSFLPNLECQTYPSRLISRWADGIVAGAIYWLKRMVDEPWSARDGGESARIVFERFVFNGTNEAQKARLYNNDQAKPQRLV